MKKIPYIVLIGFLTVTNVQSQNTFNKFGMFTLGVGASELNNNSLNRWLSSNGLNASSRYAYDFQFEALFPSTFKKNKSGFSLGWELGYTLTKNPKEHDFSLSFILWKNFSRNSDFLIVPLIGAGFYFYSIDANDPTTQPLTKYGISNGEVTRNEFLLSPKVIFIRKIGSDKNIYRFSIGMETGCRIGFGYDSWRLVGSGQNISVSGIPDPSRFHPYFSLLFGWVASKSR